MPDAVPSHAFSAPLTMRTSFVLLLRPLTVEKSSDHVVVVVPSFFFATVKPLILFV